MAIINNYSAKWGWISALATRRKASRWISLHFSPTLRYYSKTNMTTTKQIWAKSNEIVCNWHKTGRHFARLSGACMTGCLDYLELNTNQIPRSLSRCHVENIITYSYYCKAFDLSARILCHILLYCRILLTSKSKIIFLFERFINRSFYNV